MSIFSRLYAWLRQLATPTPPPAIVGAPDDNEPPTGLKFFSPAAWLVYREATKYRPLVDSGHRVGTYIDIATWNIFRVGYGLATSFLLSTLAWIIVLAMLGLGNFWLWSATMLALLAWITRRNWNQKVQPGTFYQMLVWGVPLRIYFLSGEYDWHPPGLRVEMLKKKEMPGISPEGAGYSENWPLNLWNGYTPGSKAGRETLVVGNALEGTRVECSVQMVLKHLDLALFNRSPDAIAKIADRARMATRAVLSFFTPQDLLKVKDVIALLLSGKRILVCRIAKTYRHHIAGTILRNRSGSPLFAIVEKREDVQRDTVAFRDRLTRDADPEMRDLAAREEDESLQIEVLEVKKSLVDILHLYGTWLIEVSVSVVRVPVVLEEAAVAAASQPLEAQIARDSATAAAEASRIMRATEEADKNDPHYLDRLVLATSKDPGSKLRPTAIIGGKGGGDPTILAAANIIAEALKKGKD